MSVQQLANSMAKYGRHGDDTLVHMSRSELKGLHALAEAGGAKITINPHTGLPEAFSLKKIIQPIIGAVMTYYGGPLGAAAYGAMVGAKEGSLKAGLMAGASAYAGGQIGNAIGAVGKGAAEAGAAAGAGAGQPVIGAATTNLLPKTAMDTALANAGQLAGTAPTTGLQGALNTASGLGSGAADTAGQVAGKVYTGAMDTVPTSAGHMAGQRFTGADFMAGVKGIAKDPAGGLSKLSTAAGGPGKTLAYGYGAALPIMNAADEGDDNMPEEDKPTYRQFKFNRKRGENGGPVGDYTGAETGERQWFEDTYTALPPSTEYQSGYAVGGDVNASKKAYDYLMSGSSGGTGGSATSNALSYLNGASGSSRPANPQVVTQPDYSKLNTPDRGGYGGLGGFGGVGGLGGWKWDPNTRTLVRLAEGGSPGRMVQGPGDGTSDSIPASINGQQQAALAKDEFVLPARIVSAIGNGSSEAGAQRLYAMMDRIEQRARHAERGKDSGAWSELPA